jgi:hypothetical protein
MHGASDLESLVLTANATKTKERDRLFVWFGWDEENRR